MTPTAITPDTPAKALRPLLSTRARRALFYPNARESYRDVTAGELAQAYLCGDLADVRNIGAMTLAHIGTVLASVGLIPGETDPPACYLCGQQYPAGVLTGVA